MRDDANRVRIFDTTLRDGEQSPGISLNTTEKLEIAHQLARLGVDIIEAGFPIASPGDFEAVQAIAREVEGPVIAGLARANPADVERACATAARAWPSTSSRVDCSWCWMWMSEVEMNVCTRGRSASPQPPVRASS